MVAVGALRKTEKESKEICKVGRWMYQRNLVVACEGNLSIKIDCERILVTPAGACKGRLAPEDLLMTDLNGTVVYGTGRPSSEVSMHLLYYRTRPDVNAVCHGHPPTATGFACARRALEGAMLPEVIMHLGRIPLAAYGTPGTWELCNNLEPLIRRHDAILLENHGVVTCGRDLTTAYHHMETVEQFARILYIAERLGEPHLLSDSEKERLAVARFSRATAGLL